MSVDYQYIYNGVPGPIKGYYFIGGNIITSENPYFENGTFTKNELYELTKKIFEQGCDQDIMIAVSVYTSIISNMVEEDKVWFNYN